MSWVVKPGVPAGTTKPITPSSVRAQTTATSDTEPFVIHIFCPEMIQSPPSRGGGGALRPGGGAGLRLGHPKPADRVPRRHPRQPLLLLLLRAPFPDREHRQRPLHGDEAADPRVARLQLHAGEPAGG